MINERLTPYLSLLYDKAKDSFKKCIRHEDNEFLKDEVNIPLEDIVMIEKDVKIVFDKRCFDQYSLETTLLLSDGNEEIGKYIYIENDKKEFIDDFLIFN